MLYKLQKSFPILWVCALVLLVYLSIGIANIYLSLGDGPVCSLWREGRNSSAHILSAIIAHVLEVAGYMVTYYNRMITIEDKPTTYIYNDGLMSVLAYATITIITYKYIRQSIASITVGLIVLLTLKLLSAAGEVYITMHNSMDVTNYFFTVAVIEYLFVSCFFIRIQRAVNIRLAINNPVVVR